MEEKNSQYVLYATFGYINDKNSYRLKLAIICCRTLHTTAHCVESTTKTYHKEGENRSPNSKNNSFCNSRPSKLTRKARRNEKNILGKEGDFLPLYFHVEAPP